MAAARSREWAARDQDIFNDALCRGLYFNHKEGLLMKLNGAETLLVNNPFRAWVQRHYEAPLLEHLGGCVKGGLVLEIGCGCGVGCELLFQRFGVRQVCAI